MTATTRARPADPGVTTPAPRAEAGGKAPRPATIALPPFAGVVLPWLLSRTLVAVVVLAAASAAGRPAGWDAFAAWDGGWYLEIARRGYDFANADGQTPHPFFPLLPLILRAAGALGVPMVMAGAVVSHVALLAAMWGLHSLLARRFPAAVASSATWCLAFFPGSAPFSMIYPCAIVLAASVWAFRQTESGEDSAASGLIAIAALARPNGFAVALAAAFGAGSMSRARRLVLPAAAVVLLWMGLLWIQTGDPLAFLTAKANWHEVTLGSLIAGRDRAPKLDVLSVFPPLLALAVGWNRLPGSWRVLVALWLVPPLFLGLVGVPRYVASCFPVFAAFGIALGARPLWQRAGVIAVFAPWLAFLTWRIASGRMTP